MTNHHDKDRRETNAWFTSWSLKHPFDQCVEIIGDSRIAVWANAQGLPLEVMTRLRADFAQSNSLDPRPLMQAEVRKAERAAIPLACLILGKA